MVSPHLSQWSSSATASLDPLDKRGRCALRFLFLLVLGGFNAFVATSAGLVAALGSPPGPRFLEERVRPGHRLVSSLLPTKPREAAGSDSRLFALHVPALAPRAR